MVGFARYIDISSYIINNSNLDFYICGSPKLNGGYFLPPYFVVGFYLFQKELKFDVFSKKFTYLLPTKYIDHVSLKTYYREVEVFFNTFYFDFMFIEILWEKGYYD